MPQGLLELCGAADAPVLHLAPANGFPPAVYLPLLRRLSRFRALSLPPRALWGADAVPPKDRRGWAQAADDLLAGFVQHNIRDIVAVGHSFGGIISMLALLADPTRFRALIMLDPVLLPPALLARQAAAWGRGEAYQLPLAQGALRRRKRFASQQEAFARFRRKAIFADWTDEALWLYVQRGLRRRDGAGYALRWDTAWEAYYFATVYPHVWQDLPKLLALAPAPPILIARAGKSDSFPRETLPLARSLLPSAEFIEMAGQGHLFPLAAPAATASVLNRWLLQHLGK